MFIKTSQGIINDQYVAYAKHASHGGMWVMLAATDGEFDTPKSFYLEGAEALAFEEHLMRTDDSIDISEENIDKEVGMPVISELEMDSPF